MEIYTELSHLASHAAREIEDIRVRNDGLPNVKELSKVIKEHLITNPHYPPPSMRFPYLRLLNPIEKNSGKKIRHIDELALEMKLLYNELSDVKNLPEERLKNLSQFCKSFSSEMLIDPFNYHLKIRDFCRS